MLTLCSCRQTDPRGDHHGQKGFAALEGFTYKALHAENADLVSQRKLLEMEMQWLVLRKKAPSFGN